MKTIIGLLLTIGLSGIAGEKTAKPTLKGLDERLTTLESTYQEGDRQQDLVNHLLVRKINELEDRIEVLEKRRGNVASLKQ